MDVHLWFFKCFAGYAIEDAAEIHDDSRGYTQYRCYLRGEHRSDKRKLQIHMGQNRTGEWLVAVLEKLNIFFFTINIEVEDRVGNEI